MPAERDPAAELAGLEPDARLLGEDAGALPESVGLPEPIPPSPAGRRIVAVGVTLTGATLVLGSLLLVIGVVLLVAGSSGEAIAALAAGALLTGTHWGWVHLAELSNLRLERRENRGIVARRSAWLRGLEPYVRLTVSTRATSDGGIEIVTTRHEPVRASATTFTFSRREVGIERHGPDEDAAVIAERAESLRAAAAAETERARAAWAQAAGERELERIRAEDEADRASADRAAAQALADALNAQLRSPPLD